MAKVSPARPPYKHFTWWAAMFEPTGLTSNLFVYTRSYPCHESNKTHMNRTNRQPFIIHGLPGGARGEREQKLLLCTIAELMLGEAGPMALYALKTFSCDPNEDRNAQSYKLYPTMDPSDVESMKVIIWANRSNQAELLCAFILSCEITNLPPNQRPTPQDVVNWDTVELIGVSVTARKGSNVINPHCRQGEDYNLTKFFKVLIEDSNDLRNYTDALREYVGTVLIREGKNLTIKL